MTDGQPPLEGIFVGRSWLVFFVRELSRRVFSGPLGHDRSTPGMWRRSTQSNKENDGQDSGLS